MSKSAREAAMQPETPTPEERARDWLTGECGLVLGVHTNVGAHGLLHYLAAYERRLTVQHAAAIRSASDAARADEREACAAFVQGYNAWKGNPGNPDQPPVEIADAIRARSTTEGQQHGS